MISPSNKELVVGGFVPLTTTDLPGCLSAVVFCQGCPWQCRYCHNTHLIPKEARADAPKWPDILALLTRRRGLLDAVVFSGGEPTMQPALPSAIEAVKSLGFKVGLHTAGQYPLMLSKILPRLDWVGMDIKAPLHKYCGIVQRKAQPTKVLSSLAMIMDSGVDYEFRTTVHPKLHSREDILDISHLLASYGVTRYALQEFRSMGCVDTELNVSRPNELLTNELVHTLKSHFRMLELRCA